MARRNDCGRAGVGFDPYHKWLGVPRAEQPANHYRLLGVPPFESDPEVIEAAADRQMQFVQQCASGEHVKSSQKVLNELAAARVTLLSPEKKSKYDAKLRAERERAVATASGPSVPPIVVTDAPVRPRKRRTNSAALIAGIVLSSLITLAVVWKLLPDLNDDAPTDSTITKNEHSPTSTKGNGEQETDGLPRNETTVANSDSDNGSQAGDSDAKGETKDAVTKSEPPNDGGPPIVAKSTNDGKPTSSNDTNSNVGADDPAVGKTEIQIARADLVNQYGGNAAVEAGLEWLASIQQPSGGWNYAKIGSSSQPGTLKNCTMGATSMALLAFMGAWNTHQEGDYQQQVDKGLAFLKQHAVETPAGTNLMGVVDGAEGMYVQGMATQALCEARRLTDDATLRRVSQGAVDFIVKCQDPKGGGWRYQPRQIGDTSVLGWQMLALRSAKYAKLRIPSNVLRGATVYLNSAAVDGGARYAYGGAKRVRKPSTTMTAIGLLCRMYMGVKRDNELLRRGIDFIESVGPRRDNIYFDYYATQVMFHYGGEHWTRWNAKMRDQLLESQIRVGSDAGTWTLRDKWKHGGRFYQTCLSLWTLEIYYRHPPLYTEL